MHTLPTTAYITRARDGQRTDVLVILGPGTNDEIMLAHQDLPTPATTTQADRGLHQLGYRRTTPWRPWLRTSTLFARIAPNPTTQNPPNGA